MTKYRFGIAVGVLIVLTAVGTAVLTAGVLRSGTHRASLPDVHQPAQLVGKWVNVLDANGGPSGFDSVMFTANGPAAIRSTNHIPGDFKTWRVVIDSTPAHGATVCLDRAGIGDAICDAFVLSGDRMTLGMSDYRRVK